MDTPTAERFTPGVRPHPGDPAWREARLEILARDGWRCQNCGVAVHLVDSPMELDADSACVDHIVPIIRGGWHTEENLQALCLMCNSVKGNEVIDYRADIVLRAHLAEQIVVREIDVDSPIRYTRRVSGRVLRTEQLRIAVTPDEKQWVKDTFGSPRAFVDLLSELLTAEPAG